MRVKGLSLIEIILAVMAVGFLILLVANLPPSINAIAKSRRLSLAGNIATKQTDLLRKRGYASLVNGSTTFIDPDLSKLPGGSGSYEVAECPGTVCTQGEKLKQIKVLVHWQEGSQLFNAQISTLVAEGGVSQ